MSNSHTRRDLLRASACSGLLLISGSGLYAASDFWNKKPSADWSDDEIIQLKNKSPWAKKIQASLPGGGGGGRGGDGNSGGGSMDRAGSKGTFGGMSGADSNGISEGGGRGGGRGGDAGGGGGQSGGSLEIVIRWESAVPVLEITKLKLPPSFEGHYAISVTGLPPQLIMMALSGGGRGRGREGSQAEVPQPPEDPAARQKAAVDRLLQSTTLSAKAKDPESADLVVQTTDKQSLIFGFAKQRLPLAAGDKDVQFTMKLGPTSLKAKFDPKEMIYKGELAI